ncbi:DUF1919 domain-containing protein [Vibrio lentus]
MNERLINFIRSKLAKLRRLFICSEDFSIISDNCWGGFVYQNFDLEYKTPFIGLFIFAPDYIRMLKSLTVYLEKEVYFIPANKSRYIDEMKRHGIYNCYPIGVLGDVELHFMHYQSEEEAIKKWNRRLKRLNYDNLIIKFWEGDGASLDDIQEFNKLEFKNKHCFTSKDMGLESTINIANRNGLIDNEWMCFKKKHNIIKFMNRRLKN